MKNLKGAFNDLVESMKRYDLYQVGMELDNLSSIIDEVEKRIECVKRTNIDSHEILFTNQVKLEESIGYDNVEILQRSVNDINIAMDLNDSEPIENNWYSLFEVKEVEDKFKPRSVSEYVATLPKEEPKVLIPKDSIVEWKETKQYYSVKGGAKARVTEDYTTEHEINDLCIQVKWLDKKAKGQVSGGYYLDMFKEEFELPSVPTFLCHSDDNHNIVKDVISKLKDIGVDGETMQYIIEQVGMNDQMLRQLIMSNPHTDTTDILEEKVRLSDAMSLNKKTRGCIEI
jgi:hypothetical protein